MRLSVHCTYLLAGCRFKSRFQLGIPFSLDALCPGEWCGRFDCQGSAGLTSPAVKVVNDHQYMVYLLCRAVSVRRYHDICTFRVACQCDDHPATMCADHETDTSAQVLPLNVRTSNQKCNLANVHCAQQCLLSDRIWDVGVTCVNNPFALSSTGLSDQVLAWCSDTVNATKIHLIYHESFQLVLLLFTNAYFPFRNLDQQQQGIMTWWALTNDQHWQISALDNRWIGRKLPTLDCGTLPSPTTLAL